MITIKNIRNDEILKMKIVIVLNIYGLILWWCTILSFLVNIRSERFNLVNNDKMFEPSQSYCKVISLKG